MKRLILCIVISISIYACVSVHSNFTYYEEQPSIKGISNQIRINGIYFIKNPSIENPSGYFYFYKDGSVYVSTPIPTCCHADSIFWSNPRVGIQNLKESTDRWGAYIIRHDSIFIQYFRLNHDYWMKRNSSELQGIIKNDSTIMLTKIICQWCATPYGGAYRENNGVIVFKPGFEYRFYPFTSKPDSTKAWYKQQNWYKSKKS